MRIDPTQFWANTFLYYYENQVMIKLVLINKIKARYFQSIK